MKEEAYLGSGRLCGGGGLGSRLVELHSTRWA